MKRFSGVAVLAVAMVFACGGMARASLSYWVSLSSREIVYDPALQVAESIRKPRLGIYQRNAGYTGYSLEADRIQVDFRNKTIRASGNVYLDDYYGTDAVIDMEYGTALMFAGARGERRLKFEFGNTTEADEAAAMPDFAKLPKENIIRCARMYYSNPGDFEMSDAYFEKAGEEKRYSAKIRAESPDLLRRYFKISADYDRWDSSGWNQSYSGTISATLWVANSLKRAATFDVYRDYRDNSESETNYSINQTATVGRIGLDGSVRINTNDLQSASLEAKRYFKNRSSIVAKISDVEQNADDNYDDYSRDNRSWSVSLSKWNNFYSISADASGSNFTSAYSRDNSFNTVRGGRDSLSARISVEPVKTSLKPYRFSMSAWKSRDEYDRNDTEKRPDSNWTFWNDYTRERDGFSLSSSLSSKAFLLPRKFIVSHSILYGMGSDKYRYSRYEFYQFANNPVQSRSYTDTDKYSEHAVYSNVMVVRPTGQNGGFKVLATHRKVDGDYSATVEPGYYRYVGNGGYIYGGYKQIFSADTRNSFSSPDTQKSYLLRLYGKNAKRGYVAYAEYEYDKDRDKFITERYGIEKKLFRDSTIYAYFDNIHSSLWVGYGMENGLGPARDSLLDH